MRLEVGGERIERALNVRIVAVARRRAAEPFDPRAALGVIGEESVQLWSVDTASRRDRAVGPAVAEPHQRPRGIWYGAHPHMHLIAFDRRGIGNSRAADFGKRLLSGDDRVDLQQAQTWHRSRRAFDAIRISDADPEHLIAAAKPKHMSAAPHMRGNVDVPANFAERLEVGD